MNLIQKTVLAMVLCFVLHIGTIAVQAAAITPIYHGGAKTGAIEWNAVLTTDTTVEAKINSTTGGKAVKYELFIDGTPDTVTLKLQAGKTSGSLKDIDNDDMPDGTTLSSTSTFFTNVCLVSGNFAAISFTSAGGGSQNIDIWLTPIGECN